MSYISILAIAISVLNTYPILASRNLVFVSKETMLRQQANEVSISLSALENMNVDTARNVMAMLDIDGFSRITVVDSNSDILYQKADTDQPAETYDVDELIGSALGGEGVFFSRFAEGAFLSSAAVPITSRGTVTGCVYIYEYDAAEGSIISALRKNLGGISVALVIFALVICTIYSGTFTRRITKVLAAIQNVREGEYTYRVDIKGNDELTQLSEEFNSLTSRLQSTEETRRRFVADASHELRTPLASIRLLSDTILQSDDIDRETIQEFVSDIRNESERLAHTTTQLLDLTKLDNSIAQPPVPVDCGPVASRVLRTLNPIAREAEVALESRIGEGLTVLATEDELFRTIYNLVENAIKYSFCDGTVELIAERAGDQVSIEILDSGVGIPEHDLPHIFDRFYRVDKSRDRAAGGSGLGLSIVKSTVEKYGGTVSAQRRDDGGMRFAVLFPLYSGEGM